MPNDSVAHLSEVSIVGLDSTHRRGRGVAGTGSSDGQIQVLARAHLTGQLDRAGETGEVETISTNDSHNLGIKEHFLGENKAQSSGQIDLYRNMSILVC